MRPSRIGELKGAPWRLDDIYFGKAYATKESPIGVSMK